MDIKKFCQELPKVELHAHLTGSISLHTMEKLCDPQMRMIMKTDIKEYEKNQDGLECFKLFKLLHMCIKSERNLYIATCDVIEDFHKDNVIYLELRSTPRHTSEMSKDLYVQTVLKAIRDCKIRIPEITVKYLVSMDRTEHIESSKENVQLAMTYNKIYPDDLVGIDLSGDPRVELSTHLCLLGTARNAGLKVAIHCAEVPDMEDEISLILEFQPDRLGHCTCMPRPNDTQNELLNTLFKSKIPVELCLTSNLKCRAMSNLDDHQFKYLYLSKHPIAISTDDKGIFDTTLSKEYELVGTHFKIEKEQLKELSLKAVQYTFTTVEEKKRLSSIIKNFEIE